MTELERTVEDLTALIGYGPFKNLDHDVGLENPLVVQGLRKWVELMGVPYSRANGDATYKLAASWKNQSYLSKWAEGATRDERGRGRARKLNWDDGDVQLSPDSRNERQAQAQGQAPNAPVQLDERAIIRAANAVIVTRLEEAKRELGATIQRNVLGAVETALGTLDLDARVEETKAKLLESAVNAATLAAHDYLERMIPKRIELAHNGKIKRLDSAPRHQVFEECIRWLALGEHVYLVGNAGTGKTYLFRQLAEALDQPVTILNPALTKYEFSGHLGPTGEYVTTLLRTAVEEGHLLCFDEYDMNAPGAIGFLNTLTANRFIAFPDRMVEAHERFKVLAAANTYGRGPTMGFVGRNPMDAASLDRFVYVECPYDESLELQIFGESAWIAYVHKVREAVERLQLKHIISMRAIQRGLRGIQAGFSADQICFGALWRGLPEDTILKIKNIAGEFTLPRSEGEERPEPKHAQTKPNGHRMTNLDHMRSAVSGSPAP